MERSHTTAKRRFINSKLQGLLFFSMGSVLSFGCVHARGPADGFVQNDGQSTTLERPIEVGAYASLVVSYNELGLHPVIPVVASELRSLAARTGWFVVKSNPRTPSLWEHAPDSSAHTRLRRSLVAEIQYLDLGTLEETCSLLSPTAGPCLVRVVNSNPANLFFMCGIEIDMVERTKHDSFATTCSGYSYVSMSFPAHQFDKIGLKACTETPVRCGSRAAAIEPDPGGDWPACLDGAIRGARVQRVIIATVKGALRDLLNSLGVDPKEANLAPIPFAYLVQKNGARRLGDAGEHH